MLVVSNFELYLENRKLLEGDRIEVEKGEKAILIGPNGAGKTSLFKGIMGIEGYLLKGKIEIDGEDISSLPTEERFKKGLFLFFQNTADLDIPFNRLINAIILSRFGEKDNSKIEKALNELNLDNSFLYKQINGSLSGGEKKRIEMLQLLVSSPKYALIDEFDSGLDFDGINNFVKIINSADFGAIIITHQASISKMINASKYYLLNKGKLTQISRAEMDRIISEGYGS